jgi:uncharacterized cofD-like protein
VIKLTGWLQPGIKIKRWLFVATIGWLLTLIGGVNIATNFHENALSAFALVFIHLSLEASIAGMILGILLMLTSLFFLLKNVILEVTHHENAMTMATDYFKKKQLEKGPIIVAIGGGTGLSTILSGLKHHSSNLTAIVTVADDGGSSGRLRKDLQMLAPGDIRNCIVALAQKEELLSDLLQYRFSKGEGLTGHCFGNLLIAALTDIRGGFLNAVLSTSEVLAIRGEVLPSTCKDVTLFAHMEDGTIVSGESKISKTKGIIKRVELNPPSPEPPEEVICRINDAEAILLGPGSLYTSVIPNLLVEGICEAINKSSAPVIYIANIMTQPGETDNFNLDNHIEALMQTTKLRRLDYILTNNKDIPDDRIEEYRKLGSNQIGATLNIAGSEKTTLISAPLLCENGLIRHSPAATAQKLIEIISSARAKNLKRKPPSLEQTQPLQPAN